MNDPSNANSETTPADTDRPVTSSDYATAARKVRDFPQTAGVYLMKDIAGRVIYVGKAKKSTKSGFELLSEGCRG
jgi:excinuclease ABC subunit C